ncbi:MAG TPA: NAD-dependent epimerase/dehydratase family protein [Flavitalea sp.]|nr:NAD-dependent epimerase/dehydratase family protein [Flavitalea sp.]
MGLFSGKKILITGGGGFIGSNLVKRLVQEDCELTVLDDFFTGSREHIKSLPCEIIEGTVTDVELVNKCVSGKDIVFHLAARNIIISNKNPREDLEVNVVGSFNVFEACRNHNVSRVVYSSTSSIYGNPKILPISEDAENLFLSFYSASKFSAEVYAKAFHEVYGLPIAVVRYSNVFGYNQSPSNPYCGVIGKFLDSALANTPITIHGDGEQTRDFTFIDDAVQATIQCAVAPKAIGETYNVGTGVEVSVNTLAGMIRDVTGTTCEIQYIDKRDIDNIRRRVVNIEKARHELKYSPQFTLKRGLEKTVEWFRNNKAVE